MSTLTNIEQLSPDALAKLEIQIATLKAKREAGRANLQAFLSQAAEKMQSLAQAAGLAVPILPSVAGQPHVGAGNGHKPAPKMAKRTVRRARRARAQTPVVAAPAKPQARPRSKHPVPIKYRDPNNLTNTWSGRGKPPRWMTATGLPKETFLISQAGA